MIVHQILYGKRMKLKITVEQEGSAMRTRTCLEYEGRIGPGYSRNHNYNDNNSPAAVLCAARSRLRAAGRCGQAGGCSAATASCSSVEAGAAGR